MSPFERDGIQFHYASVGVGRPLVLQHGLGGDVAQPLGLYRPPVGWRMVSLDCRAHGRTAPVGDPGQLRIATMADDVVALCDWLGIERAVVGGISMGAALALNLALRYPHRVSGLVLSRPAWLDAPREYNQRIYALIARLIREVGAREAKQRFAAGAEYREALAASPDAAQSLLGQFDELHAEACVARLEAIPADRPIDSLAQLSALSMPTLVLANRQDPIHPFEYGAQLAAAIPGSKLVELTAKSVSRERHVADFQQALDRFLTGLAASW